MAIEPANYQSVEAAVEGIRQTYNASAGTDIVATIDGILVGNLNGKCLYSFSHRINTASRDTSNILLSLSTSPFFVSHSIMNNSVVRNFCNGDRFVKSTSRVSFFIVFFLSY